tara:strand:+ start:477 stop:1025 length:549 start_codon:yes stop_codon:yes gene_type:complete
MKFIFKFKILSLLLLSTFLFSCSKVRESAGVTRKSIDEFQSVENAPLVIPPDFNLTSPDKIQEKDIDDVEKELAEQILFGLDNNNQSNNQKSSAMLNILDETNALDVSEDIRKEINEEFAQETESDSIYDVNWETEKEVLDAVKESERIRNKNFEGKSIADGEVPTKKEKIKTKKKKRFWIF